MFENLISVFESNQWVWLASVFVFSLLVGSFLNVVIYRLPIMLERDWRKECEELLADELKGKKIKPADNENFNLIVPNSTCPKCKKAIKPWQNIPVLSWLFLRGKCANCQNPISIRYPIMELLTATLGLWAAYYYGVSSLTLWALIFTFILISLCFIDLDTMLLPDQLTLGLLWLGLLVNINHSFVSLEDAVIGAALGYMSLWSVFQLFKLITGKEGMGFGDFKLLAALGAWMGWQALPVIIILSSLVGAVIGIAMLKLQQKDSQQAIPFGPYLAVAGLIAFYWRSDITQYYLQTWVY
ncbi:prepilin peptidase [Catenovulum maritimum]|uniref:Prepilin leader peptidase/N-methyltransferase n=1 Tax=Catenovulum maritimum TaxID=1513271 RepID=A0A0J8JND9_9ALTE|nr:A24 family peptidase [Catenovulum maritimum]KMT66126.1 methyltransferase [Catenovulum maritimum]